MRAAQNGEIYFDRRGRIYRRMSFEQRAQLRKYYNTNVPRWRRPIIGYVITVPIIAICSLLIFYLTHLMSDMFFPGVLFLLCVLFVALLWGVGPAILAILLSSVVLETGVINATLPFQSGNWNDALNLLPFNAQRWNDVLHLLPFIVAGLIVASITVQRERARLQALAAEQELQLYARDLEEINKQLEDANQMKDHFLSIASHELKTPITTIRGQAQLLLHRISKKPIVGLDNVSPALERINEQTSRLTALIDDLLDVSSMRAGKVELNRRLYDVRKLCQDVVEDQKLLTERHIVLDMPSTPVNILVDIDRLSQVITNLISNALKYSSDTDPIEVKLRSEDGHIMLQVTDHGRGIAHDQQKRIFETFYRTPDAQSSAKRGLGLGLAITKDIVERHGGRVWVESKAGQGSTFFVEIPDVHNTIA